MSKPETNTHLYALEHLLRSFEDMAAPLTNRERLKKYDVGQYPYIALPTRYFTEQLEIVRDLLRKEPQRPMKFIDVGCGIGTKLVIAKYVCPEIEVHGIEITDKYVSFAKKLLKGYNNGPRYAVVHKRDALRYNYAGYDIIYFYCPLSDPKLETRLENRIVQTATKGAYILANSSQDYELWKDRKKLKPVYDNTVYQKV